MIPTQLRRMLTRDMRTYPMEKTEEFKAKYPIEGIYIVYFEDKKWRVAPCHNMVDIETPLGGVHRHNSPLRKLSQYDFVNTYFKDAPCFAGVGFALIRAESMLKEYPAGSLRDGIAIYPGEYRTPYKSMIAVSRVG